MSRAVLDPNVIISGLLSPAGNAARLLRAREHGEFELIASPALLDELQRALAYPKLRRRIADQDAESVARWLTESATLASDPAGPPRIPSEDDRPRTAASRESPGPARIEQSDLLSARLGSAQVLHA